MDSPSASTRCFAHLKTLIQDPESTSQATDPSQMADYIASHKDRIQYDVATAEGEIDSMKADIAELQRTCNEFQKALVAGTSVATNHDRRIQQQDNAGLREEIGDLKRVVKGQQQDITGLHRENEVPAKEIAAQDKKIEAQAKRFEAYEKRFEAQDKRIEAQDKRIEAQDKRIEAQDKRIKSQAEHLKNQGSSARTLASKLTRSDAKVARLDSSVTGLEHRVKILEPLCESYVRTTINAGIAELRRRAIRELQGVLGKPGRAQHMSNESKSSYKDEINRDDKWMQSMARRDFPEDLDWIAKSHLQLLHDATTTAGRKEHAHRMDCMHHFANALLHAEEEQYPDLQHLASEFSRLFEWVMKGLTLKGAKDIINPPR